jgi:hypothetical protein
MVYAAPGRVQNGGPLPVSWSDRPAETFLETDRQVRGNGMTDRTCIGRVEALHRPQAGAGTGVCPRRAFRPRLGVVAWPCRAPACCYSVQAQMLAPIDDLPPAPACVGVVAHRRPLQWPGAGRGTGRMLDVFNPPNIHCKRPFAHSRWAKALSWRWPFMVKVFA